MQSRLLGPQRIKALVTHWQQKNPSTGTVKNRMATPKWWAEKANKRNAIAKPNEYHASRASAL